MQTPAKFLLLATMLLIGLFAGTLFYGLFDMAKRMKSLLTAKHSSSKITALQQTNWS